MKPGLTPFKPGTSGNRAGRPRGFAGVARQIMTETRDGAELIEWALGVWRDTSRPYSERAAAHAWLSDRGLGRPLQSIDLSATLSTSEPGDDDALAESLTLEQLAELDRLDDERDRVLQGNALPKLPAGARPAAEFDFPEESRDLTGDVAKPCSKPARDSEELDES